MARSSSQLRADAERIWWAGVRAVLPERLIPAACPRRRRHAVRWATMRSICAECVGLPIVGAGKAAGAMAVALENALGAAAAGRKERDRLGQRAGRLRRAHAMRSACTRLARRASTSRGRKASRARERILEIVSSLGPDDLCFCLLSGGGSALLPAPVPGISLDDKIRVTRLLECRRREHRAAQHGAQPTEPGQRRRAGAGLPCRPT